MSYIVLRSRWCKVHAPSKEKCDGKYDTFYVELEQVFSHFPKYDTKILVSDFSAK
jgi:hypothetical protein